MLLYLPLCVGAKPILQEIGPFVYTHHHEFFDISFAQDKNTVDCKRFEKFLPYSGDPENVKVTVANIPYAGVRAVVDPDDEWFTALGMDDEFYSNVNELFFFLDLFSLDRFRSCR